MNIGVSFKTLPSNNILYQILKCIEIRKYCWHNIDSQNEVWDSPQGNLFFDKEYYNGNNFLKKINSNHFMVFLKLQAYIENDEFFDIQTYEEFQKSNCQLLLLLYDCEFVEIYAKDQMVIQAIHENALGNNYLQVQYINENVNSRIKMNVL